MKDLTELTYQELYAFRQLINDMLASNSQENRNLVNKSDDELTEDELNLKKLIGARHMKGAHLIVKINDEVNRRVNEYI